MTASTTTTGPGRRAALAAALAFALLLAAPALAAPAGDPEAFVASLGERALAVVRRDPGPERRARDLVGLLDQTADTDLVGRLALGRHWQAASEAQRAEYGRLFRDYLRDRLARRLGAYTGGERPTPAGSQPAGDTDTLAGTRIVLAEGAPVEVGWRVRREGGRLVVVDMVAEGVSMLVTTRSQLAAIVNQRGIDGLLAAMRAWHAAADRAGPA